MARLTIESQAAPAAQGPLETQFQEYAAVLAGACGIIALANPGVLAGAAVAWAWRWIKQPRIVVRLICAFALAALLIALQSFIAPGWPWRDALARVPTLQVAPVNDAIALRSFCTEALAGPLWFEGMLLATVLWRRRVDAQIRHDHRLDKRRWNALTGRRQRPLADRIAPPTDRSLAHPAGCIRLCADEETNRPFDLKLPEDLAAHIFLPGATGTGKTTTVARMGDGALANGYAAIFVDCKGGGLRAVAERLAARHHVPFYLVDPESPHTFGYNPCSGDASSVANKLIGAFTYSPAAEIYKNIAMEMLPVVVRGLQAANVAVTLDALYDALSPGGIENVVHAIEGDDPLRARLLDLSARAGDRTGAGGQAGLRHRLGALLEGRFGTLFRITPALDLEQVITTPSVTYIALSTLASSEDVELMGRVYAQDFKQLCARRIRALGEGADVTPVLTVWDEFAALNEATQLVDLLLQARQALMPTVISTQYLPENLPLRKAVLGAGLLIAHRVEGEDAEAIANQFGTRRGGELTSQVDFETGFSEKGSLRRVEKYNVHPNELRTFKTGQAALKSVPQGRYSIVRIYEDAP
ncbi:MAG TPA: hypothetical protein VGY54_04830 [Polyangiaceae bacterium]|jgi:hypothetical protein|nr:hypothetical protein [Polyangiaceae bacterium]